MIYVNLLINLIYFFTKEFRNGRNTKQTYPFEQEEKIAKQPWYLHWYLAKTDFNSFGISEGIGTDYPSQWWIWYKSKIKHFVPVKAVNDGYFLILN